MGLRNAVALHSGATEELLATSRRADDPGIAAKHRAALLLCQAYLENPETFSADAAAEVSAVFTPGDVVELLVRLIMWSSDKTLIGLGLDLDEPIVQTY
jgi:hypothetical protein